MGLGLVITPQEEVVIIIMAVLRGEQVSGWTRMGLKMKMISNLGEIG
jgi:hypothetical protein